MFLQCLSHPLVRSDVRNIKISKYIYMHFSHHKTFVFTPLPFVACSCFLLYSSACPLPPPQRRMQVPAHSPRPNHSLCKYHSKSPVSGSTFNVDQHKHPYAPTSTLCMSTIRMSKKRFRGSPLLTFFGIVYCSRTLPSNPYRHAESCAMVTCAHNMDTPSRNSLAAVPPVSHS